jgi:hypothetical protein
VIDSSRKGDREGQESPVAKRVVALGTNNRVAWPPKGGPRFTVAGLSWPLPTEMSEAELAAALFRHPSKVRFQLLQRAPKRGARHADDGGDLPPRLIVSLPGTVSW